MANSASPCQPVRKPGSRVSLLILILFLAQTRRALSADWSTSEQQLARKIVAVTGAGVVTLTIDNRSSINRRDLDIVSAGLRSSLESDGIRIGPTQQATSSVAVTLSENAQSYVWVAEIRRGTGDPTVVMVSVPRGDTSSALIDAVPMSIRVTSLVTQVGRILDVAILEANQVATRIAVLDADQVSILRMQNGEWQKEQVAPVNHSHPWPRDLRGRLVPARDHLFDVYLPEVSCRTVTGSLVALECRESDDPWPLVIGSIAANSASQNGLNAAGTSLTAIPVVGAFFAPARNFFTGVLAPEVAKGWSAPAFYSAAVLPHGNSVLWLFAATDGSIHMVDGLTDTKTKLNWGSDLASVRTQCGANWQVLAAGPGRMSPGDPSAGDSTDDSVRAYEFPDREALPVSAAVDLPGEITALWTDARGDGAIAISRNRKTDTYAAFRLEIVCSR